MNGTLDTRNLLTKARLVGVDTNAFVYYFDRESALFKSADRIFTQIVLKNIPIITCTITLAELLSFKAGELSLKRLEEEFVSMSNLKIVDIDYQIAREAARFKREYSFGLADSIQLSAAFCYRADIFITADKRLKNFKEIPVMLIK